MKKFLLPLLCAAWNYGTQSSWSSTCSDPESSPVSIKSASASLISSSDKMRMVFLGFTGSQTIVNTGNMISINSNLGYIEIGDINGRRFFTVDHLEFHSPSEHQIDGIFFPIEMQIVCRIQDKYWDRNMSNIAVVSVMIKPGINSYFLDSLEISRWGNELKPYYSSITTSSISNPNLAEVVLSRDNYWFYVGTGTHPNLMNNNDMRCDSNVLRFIIKDVKEASSTQVNIIKSIFSANSKTLTSFEPVLYTSFSYLIKVSLLIITI